MIDRETAIQWIKDAEIKTEHENFLGGIHKGRTIQFQALITRAQAEAYEKAAQLFDSRTKSNALEGLIYSGYAQAIRALKEQA